MHNRARMVVASFLAKDLLLDWRWGERFFMQRLIDGEPASNNGGWQWSASTGTDAQPYFRIFNPVAQGERFDPRGRTCGASFPRCGGFPTAISPSLGIPVPSRRLSPAHRGPRPPAAAGAGALPGRAGRRPPMTPPGKREQGKTPSPRELWRDDAPLRIGISSCLLGEEVRWDGGHKRDRFLTDVLEPYVEWVPICPEVEVGMGTPREPVRLVRQGDEIAMLGTKSGRDWSAPMRAWSEKRARQLTRLDLCGYVLKKDSPSCGMERVKVEARRACPRRKGRGSSRRR